MNIRKQAGYLGVGGKRVIGGLGSNTALDAYIRSLGPAAWFRMDQGVTVTGAGISQVDDLSGNARHLLDPGTTRPIYLPYSGTKYLYLPGVAGNYASTPDSAANSITGDIDIRVRVAMDDWTPAATTMLVAKDGGGAQRCFHLNIQTAGQLSFTYSNDGTSIAGRVATSSVATGVSDGAVKWVRSTYASASGKVNFFLSDDGTTWSALGTEQTITSGSIFDSATSPLEIGSFGYGAALNAKGKIYRAIIKNGIDGTTVVDFNPADADGDGDTSFASSTTGETWTINSSGGLPAQIVGRAAILFNGTSHYLKTNAFTLNQPTCVLMVVKQVSWTNGDTIFDGDAANSGRLRQLGTTGQHAIYASGTPSPTNVAGPTVGAIAVLSIGFNGASSFIKVNAGAATTGNPGANNMGGFTLGANGDVVGTHSNIQVYETVIFPIAPSTAQLDRLVAGLMARNGVS